MKNQKLRNSYKTMYCYACNKRGCDPCHIKSYATTLKDDPENLIPLCRKHHTEQHAKGFVYMFEKYPLLKRYLLAMGFEVIETFGIKKLIKK